MKSKFPSAWLRIERTARLEGRVVASPEDHSFRPLLKTSAGTAGEHPATKWPTGDGKPEYRDSISRRESGSLQSRIVYRIDSRFKSAYRSGRDSSRLTPLSPTRQLGSKRPRHGWRGTRPRMAFPFGTLRS
jgi:hypothetical protein